MPDLPISGLPLAGTLTGTEIFPLVQGGITKYSTLDTIRQHNSTYGVFQTNQTLSGSANVSQSFVLDTTDEAVGISIVDGTKITFTETGVYNIQFSAQISQGPQAAIVYIWFKQNGQNIIESNTAVTIPSNQLLVAAWNFMKTFSAGDYAEIVWRSTQNTTTFPYLDPDSGMPVIPALIVTVTQIR